ncbi:ABI family, member 3 (NESH) binding protein b isoform X3 [Cynoglossus semilaevis]|uniref:ABI family, member 3 (NESH) binding protein b isoform X3 n=1 Tax=Cynoglossus semilaevis TaxID=244447 RepID=UPI000D62DE7E|nr:target of Nesh-SH3-like isoform X3 [Cynoglossus semilaevis]
MTRVLLRLVLVLLLPLPPQMSGLLSSRVRRPNIKVWINVTGDTVMMKFLRPNADMKLEGYVLGYGSSIFSKQFIQLPENGEPYSTELKAEPKYLIAVQPIPVNNIKKHCKGTTHHFLSASEHFLLASINTSCSLMSSGKVNLQEPLHLVIGSVTPTTVLLSWGNTLKTSYEGNVMKECLEEGFYTVRYRERNRKWNYRTCPTTDTVIDHLKPNTPYEFSVQSNTGQRSGAWSKSLIHSTDTDDKKPHKTFGLLNALNPSGPQDVFPPRLALHNRTHTRNLPPPRKVHTLTETGANFKLKDSFPVLKPKAPPTAARATKQQPKTTVTTPTSRGTSHATPTSAPAPHQETWEESELFQSQPTSDLDASGKKRYVAPHVIYQTGKRPDEPCSITSSLAYFPEDKSSSANVAALPEAPPSNLTVVTVEGCPSFVILDWDKTDNSTTEYEVISTAKGPDGEKVSILTTNQTHTAVENLKPESSYEFKVKPKNELGAGPASQPVSFNTESADPRVSENASGKDAIWTQFPFKTDSYSDCHGKQYIKRTWYRKFVGVQLCNSLRYKIYLSDTLNGKFYNIGDQSGFGEDHCQFVDSFLEGKTGRQLQTDQLPSRPGFYRAVRQEPVHFGKIGGHSHTNYVSWYECGIPIPGKW